MKSSGLRYLRLRPRADRFRSTIVALAAVMSGVLLGCCYPPINAAPLAWIAIAPLGLALTAKRLGSEGWAGVYLGGLAYHLIALDWITEFEPHVAFEVVWLILGQLAALVFCFSMLIARRMVARFDLPVCVGLPIFWLGFELLRSFVGSLVDPAAGPWLKLGGTQVEWTLVAQIARFGGESSLSVLVALVNGWLFELAGLAVACSRSGRFKWNGGMWAAPVAVMITISYGWWRLEHIHPVPGPTIALVGRHQWLVDGERPLGWETDAELAQADLLVWPELADHHKYVTGRSDESSPLPSDIQSLAHFAPNDYSAWYRSRLSDAARRAHSGIVLGCERVDLSAGTPRRYNSVVYASAKSGFVGYGDKQNPAPLFERDAPLANHFGIATHRRYLAGTAVPRFTLASANGRQRFACIVCYDIADRRCVAELCDDGTVDFFVNCGSEATDRTGVVSQTLLRMARLRAIETRRPIVRNCHGGASGVIDVAGRFTPCAIDEGHTASVTVPLYDASRNEIPMSTTLFTLGTGSVVTMCVIPGVQRMRRRLVPWKVSSVLGGSGRSPLGVRTAKARGFSLLELLATVAILGTLAAIIVPRVINSTSSTNQRADEMNRAQINAAVERYYVVEGDWPADDLRDIADDPDYFPDGIPIDPVTEQPYRLNSTTHRVELGGGGGGK